MADLPCFHRVSALRPHAPAITAVEGAVRDALARIAPVLAEIPRGARVAVTCGSRGIDRIPEVVSECCNALRDAGARPFIVPAMGSHGGATAEGQLEVLASVGITEAAVRAPIVSSMEAVSLGRTPEGIEVFMDRAAWEASRVLVVNRVKLHTDFEGEVESGLMKALCVGLGKLDGARSFHRNGMRLGFDTALLAMGRHVLSSGRVLAGLALLENEAHQLTEIRSAPAADVEQLDRALLERAHHLHPKLPFKNLDLLVVDRMGKNISGTGIDTRVVGRSVHPEHPWKHPFIQIRRIYVRSLTEQTAGNAIGMGLADVVHERVTREADLQKTYTNSHTSLGYAVANMPMSFPNDRAALQFLLENLGSPAAADLRAAWIRDTLSTTDFFATATCVEELRDNTEYRIGPSFNLEFDSQGEAVIRGNALAMPQQS